MNEYGLKIGDVVWRMHGWKRHREDETVWSAIPMCIEYMDDRKFLDAHKCGGSWGLIGKTYFLTREECLKHWEEHKTEYAQPAVTSAMLREEKRLGSIVKDDTRFWRDEDILRVMVDDSLSMAHCIPMKDLPWEDDDVAGEYGWTEQYTTLGMIREKLYSGKVLTVWSQGPMYGEIYQTGNYPGETAWRLLGKVMGYT